MEFWTVFSWLCWLCSVLYGCVCTVWDITIVLWSLQLHWKLCGILLITFYCYSTWTFGLFRVQGIPGPRPWPILGNLASILTKGVRETDGQWLQQYGPVVGTFEGRTPVLIVADKDMLKQILVKKFAHFQTRRAAGLNEYPFRSALTRLRGGHWKRVRSLISPAFSAAKLRLISPQINACSKVLLQNVNEKGSREATINMKEVFSAYTMDVIARSAFGLELDSLHDQQNPFVTNAEKFFRVVSIMNPVALMLLVFPFCVNFLKWLQIKIMPRDATKFFIDIIDHSIESRKSLHKKPVDILQILVDAEYAQDSSNGVNTPKGSIENLSSLSNGTHFKNSLENIATSTKQLSLEEIHAQALIFFIAGYETTASTLSFLSYCLATNPLCQHRVVQEMEMCYSHEHQWDYDQYSNLPYLDMCIHEALRLYPPAVRTNRVCCEDTVIGDIVIQRGMLVVIPIYQLHMDPLVWPNPHKFIPERFSAEAKASRDSVSYIPFGAGPRHCIGSRLAMIEIKMAMIQLLRHFHIRPTQDTQVPLTFKKAGLLQPEKEIKLLLEPRRPNSNKHLSM